MKIKLLLMLFVLAGVTSTFAQQPSENVYISTQESLQKRATPQWYNDAKLGIFIHWGLYRITFKISGVNEKFHAPLALPPGKILNKPENNCFIKPHCISTITYSQ